MIEFVPFENSFAPQYVEMLEKSSQQDLDMIGSCVLSIEQVITSFTAPNRWDRLMFLDGVLVGDVNVFLPTSEEGFKPEVNVFVVESARRNGFARLAIEEAIEYCRQQGFRCLYAIIGDDNLPSIALFAQCGFDLFELIPAFKQSVYRLTL